MKKIKFSILLLLCYFITLSFQNNIESILLENPITDTSMFIAEIDGKEISFIDGNGRIRNGANIFKTFKKKPDTSSAIFQTYFYKYPAGQTDIEVNIGTLHFLGNKINKKDFNDFFKNEKYNFSPYAENGVEVVYNDKQMVQWSTTQGDQENSLFEITEIQSDSVNIKFRAIFNCKLYNSKGKSKTLEKGIIIGYFRNK